jgi:hypothetical protein
MKIATLILALFCGVASGFQSLAVFALASASLATDPIVNIHNASALGAFAALLFVIGGAFSLVPIVSMLSLAAASVAAFVSYHLGFTDMFGWGCAAITLAAMQGVATMRQHNQNVQQ